MRTRVAGIFLFLPLLAQLHFDQIVHRAGYPGSQMVPATSALLSLLALKLLGKERRGHISDFNIQDLMLHFLDPRRSAVLKRDRLADPGDEIHERQEIVVAAANDDRAESQPSRFLGLFRFIRPKRAPG